MKHGFKLGEREYDVALSRSRAGYCLHREDATHPVNLVADGAGGWWLTCDGISQPLRLACHGDDIYIHLGGHTHHLRYEHPLTRLAELAGGATEDQIRAAMPGSLVSVSVAAGDAVTTGQTLLVMESMKMETTVVAPRDAVIETLHFAPGQSFDKDAVLITLAANNEETQS